MRCSRCCLTVLLTESKFHWCVRICTHTLSHTLEKHSNDNCKNFHLTVRGEYSYRCVCVCLSLYDKNFFLFWFEMKIKIKYICISFVEFSLALSLSHSSSQSISFYLVMHFKVLFVCYSLKSSFAKKWKEARSNGNEWLVSWVGW